MAGTRLLAQLSFVLSVLCLFTYSIFLLNIHQYFGSHMQEYYTTHRNYTTVENNPYASLLYYSNLSSLRALTTEENNSLFWEHVNVALSATENDQSPPITELRVNLIFTRDFDTDINAESGEEGNKQKLISDLLDDLAFSMEEQLLSAQLLIPKIDVRILEFPNAYLHEAVQLVNNSFSSFFILTKSRVLQLFNNKGPQNIYFDYFTRTGLEPACVGSCQQVYVVVYNPKLSQQPLHISGQNTKESAIQKKYAGLLLNQNLLLMTLNDEDMKDNTVAASTTKTITRAIMTKLMIPILFHQMPDMASYDSMYADMESLYWSHHHFSFLPHNSFISLPALKVLLLARIIHFQRSITQVLHHVVELDTSGYYLHLQSDHPLFSVFTKALHAQDQAVTCLEQNNVTFKSVNDTRAHIAAGMSPATASLQRLLCAYHTLHTASQLAEELFHSPELLSEVQESYEFLLALAVPYWFPVLIPVVYGTAVEVHRFWKKRKSRVI